MLNGLSRTRATSLVVVEHDDLGWDDKATIQANKAFSGARMSR